MPATSQTTEATPPSRSPARRLYRFAWWVMAANLAVIVWGAFVRVTGSGAGCGSSWPSCNGDVVPRSPSVETMIEFTHRLTSGIALILVVVLMVRVFRNLERGHPARAGAAWTMILMLSEAGIGAGIVLFELVADNASIARALFMATHLGNTFLLLGALALTIHWLDGGPRLALRAHGRLSWLCLSGMAAAMIVGISGAVSALGDTLYPPESHGQVIADSLSPTANVLIQLRVLHPLLAIVGSLLLFYLASTVRDARRRTPAAAHAKILNLLVLAQLAIGVLNITLMAPAAMQLIHLLFADFVWIALILTVANTLIAKEPAAAAPGLLEDEAVH